MKRTTNALPRNIISKSTNLNALLTTLLLLIIAGCAAPSIRASQTDITGPAGSATFGNSVTVLPNGNIVVIDQNYSIPAGAVNVGAVYLYDGATLNLISTLTGSTANDNVGFNGITVLANGNYVVRNPNWDNGAIVDAGAVTFCNAATGTNGAVSPANSLVGSKANDNIGSNSVTALTNGNYVVVSTAWDNGAITNAGALVVLFIDVSFCFLFVRGLMVKIK